MESTRISRRRFLALGAGVGLTAGGAPIMGACGAEEGPEVVRGREITGGGDLEPSSAFPFTDAATGGPAVLVRLQDGAFAAYSAECTHQGCTVSYANGASGGGYLGCPCHNSVFEPAEGGRAVSGPAEEPLRKIPIEVRDGKVLRA